MNILIGTSIIFSVMYFQYHILERGKIICGRENAALFGPSLCGLMKGLKTYGVTIKKHFINNIYVSALEH
jgi:hypothetical protein